MNNQIVNIISMISIVIIKSPW